MIPLWNTRLIAPLAASLLLLAGCASDPLPDSSTAPIETRTPVAARSVPSGGASTGAAPQSAVAPVDLTRQGSGGAGADAMAGAEGRTVYFDFDSYVIKDEYKSVLDRQARNLTAKPSQRVVIEGYADDRGGREYNLALGQKRAEAVMRAMTLLGVAERQMEAVSFGEERPLAQGSSEDVYARNRRAVMQPK
ncbi:MAG: peptidoglycan-associated lipoprotein Pal [Rubrivivax sp.]